MSNIKLVHSGGNSVSLTTPDSNPGANRTFKLPGADGTSGQVLQTDGSGALSFATPSSTGDTAPAFKAKLSSNMSAPSASTFTVIAYNQEVFDTNNCFNTSTHRFTPNVGGYYILTAGFSYVNGNYTETTAILQIRKNGASPAEYGVSNRVGGFESRWGLTVSGVVQLNGSGDYAEAYVYGPSRQLDQYGETFFSTDNYSHVIGGSVFL